MQLIAYYISNTSCCLSYCLESVLSFNVEFGTFDLKSLRWENISNS